MTRYLTYILSRVVLNQNLFKIDLTKGFIMKNA